MKLKIAQLAPLWIPVPPRTYGGIELMLSLLTEELVKRDYDVTLFASGDSVTESHLESMTEKGLWLQKLRSPHAVIMRMLCQVYERRGEFDLIHSHAEFFMYPLLLSGSPTPILTTLHRPLDEEASKVALSYPEMNFCAISEDHKRRIEAKGVKTVGVVYNGIDTSKYEFNDLPENYFLFLSRLNEEKGIVNAIKAANIAKKKLVIAGNLVGGAEWQYFFNEIQPLLNTSNIKFVGEVDFAEKVRLMKNASALLFPIDRDEPFGLVMIEAMACGTPVIAFNRGSVPEVVTEGQTGFIVSDPEGMAKAMKKTGKLKRLDCRNRVIENFTLKMMVDKYEEIYKNLLK
jgi:glycosyltransferase involved in cell wall biosynthesis